MGDLRPGSIKKVSWAEVREQVKEIAPDIFDPIQRFDSFEGYNLYEVEYAYGAKIIDDNNIFNIPNDKGEIVPITSSTLDSELRADLGYNDNAIAVGLILKGTLQLYVTDDNNYIETANVHGKGAIIALSGSLEPPHAYRPTRYWQMTAGVRTPILLGSLGSEQPFKRLRQKYQLTCEKPITQELHWQFFRDLANSSEFPKPWTIKFLFFGKKWLESKNDDAWKLFKLALLERAWKNTSFSRSSFMMNKIWHEFTGTIRNKKVTSYTLRMANHIIHAGLGQNVCYQPVDGSDHGGPFSTIENILLEDYRPEKFLAKPIIMEPIKGMFEKRQHHYVSIQMPSQDIIRKRTSKAESLIDDTREIKYVIDKFLEDIHENNVNVKDTPYHELLYINFDFYSADHDKFHKILPVSTLFDNDQVVQNRWGQIEKRISEVNKFLRCCVKITFKI